jgi:hypothetical protein
LEQLDHVKIDDSFGSLERFAAAKWFPDLITEHNNEDSQFHFNLFEPFVIGRDLNAQDDIAYLTFSTIWHLSNFLRNIAAGWILQVNADATYKVCRRGVALFSIGVNSVPHVNNPVCWAITPEIESKEICQGTWRVVQAALFMMLKTVKVCSNPECPACSTLRDLLHEDNVVKFLRSEECKSDRLIVHATLSDCSLGWHATTREEFGFEPNMCNNHTTGIPAANYSQSKYYKSREVYDEVYDIMVRIAKLGMEVFVDKAHGALIRHLAGDLQDQDGADYFEKTWSMQSGHGRWAVCHGGYSGYVTNASAECNWRDKGEICPPNAPLGTFMGGLIKNIEAKGMEHRAALIKSGTPNRFVSIPTIGSDIWDAVASRHPKTLAACTLEGASDQVTTLFNATTAEIFEMGDDTTALHIKIGLWHADLKAKDEHALLETRMLKNVIVPRQSLLFKIDPTNSRPLNDVRREIWEHVGAYKRLQMKGNREHETMTVEQILDLAEMYHDISWKGVGWSAVPFGCCCVGCYKYLACCHGTLLEMMLNATLTIPKVKEPSEPSLRKGRIMVRGTAGQKRKRLLAAMKSEKKVGIKRASTCRSRWSPR